VREVPCGCYDEWEGKWGGKGGGGAAGKDRHQTIASLRLTFDSGSGMGMGNGGENDRRRKKETVACMLRELPRQAPSNISGTINMLIGCITPD
jgi:hypothetical protein